MSSVRHTSRTRFEATALPYNFSMAHSHDSTQERLSEAERIFADYLEDYYQDKKIDFAELCAEHESISEELQGLFTNWRKLGPSVVVSKASFRSLQKQLEKALGKNLDPEISLEPKPRPGKSPESFLEKISLRDESYNRYLNLGEIARGGMGSILKVWDEDLRRSIAMKVILSQHNALSKNKKNRPVSDQTIGRFLKEAQITAQLTHPGIVPVHELGIDDHRRVYFTMKLVRGRTFGDVISMVDLRKNGWTLNHALRVLLKVCDAVAYAHSKGVVHRDLKPANIMVGDFGEAYVMDWGLAKVEGTEDLSDPFASLADLQKTESVLAEKHDFTRNMTPSPVITREGDILGTPAYMPPEQACGDTLAMGPPVDIYAIGAILYQLLTNRVPYAPEKGSISPHKLRDLVLEGPPSSIHKLNSKVPAELAAICDKAMERKTAKRYSSVDSLANDISAYLDGHVVRAYETGALAEARKWILRHKSIAAGFLIVVFVAIAASAVQAHNLGLVAAAKTQERVAKDKLSLKNSLEEISHLRHRFHDLGAPLPSNLSNLRNWAKDANEIAGRSEEIERALDKLRQKIEPPTASESQKIDEERRSQIQEFDRELENLQIQQKRHELTKPEEGSQWNPIERTQYDKTAKGYEERIEDLQNQIKFLQHYDERQEIRFSNPEDYWWQENLAKFKNAIDAFKAPHHGLLARANELIAIASSIEEKSLLSKDAQRAWDLAREAFAEADSPYAQMEWMKKQLGLYPIGRDPESNLLEFAHLLSGDIPTRDNTTQEIILTEQSAIILVLIPAGSFYMGAQSYSSSSPNYDNEAVPNELPVTRIELDPFFISKYEITQAQWKRIMKNNPSQYHQEKKIDQVYVTGLHPVEMISWKKCREFLRLTNLEFPTEAQWEYAARSRTEPTVYSSWLSGNNPQELKKYANIADESYFNFTGYRHVIHEDWDDSFEIHAPVGSLKANAFGLHDMAGNVQEFCRFYSHYHQTPAKGTGERNLQRESAIVLRGGSWKQPKAPARSAFRMFKDSSSIDQDLGLRPVLSLQN